MSGNFAETNVKMPDGLPFIPYSMNQHIYEISCALFDNCNLNCTFCFSKRKDNKVDRNHILNMPHEIMNEAIKDIKRFNIKVLNIRSWGGELFFDALKDDVFQTYRDYINEYKKLCKELCPNVELKFHWLSNGVWTKWERVKQLLDDTQSTLSFSYDPIGRFTSEKQIELLFENIERFKQYHNSISVTLTKETINHFMQGDKWLSKLDKNYFNIDANYYWANRDYKTNTPNDNDLYNFFIYCIENKWFNIDLIKGIIENCIEKVPQRYCNCLFTAQYNLGRYTKDCVARTSILDPHKFYGKYTEEVNEDNVTAIKNSLMLQKRKCLLCDKFSYCPLGCMGAMLLDEYKVDSNCPYKRIIEYIESNMDVIKQNFNEWREKSGK